MADEQSRLATLARGSAMWLAFFAGFHLLAAALGSLAPPPAAPSLRNMVYLTGQHPIVPTDLDAAVQDVTHVMLAFMRSDVFNRDETDAGNSQDWPLYTTIDAVRARFAANTTKILVAIGGWGDTAGFCAAARTPATRARFARNVARMLAATGADGVDIDWEFPGGNGEDYRQVPNARRAWEVEAHVLLLAAVREQNPNAVLSAAVPGRPEDRELAWTAATVPRILQHVDFLNVMAYDLLNRRDHVTAHHSGVAASLAAVDAYMAAGAPPSALNLGLAYYVKYVRTEHADCADMVVAAQRGGGARPPLGCRTVLLEDPETGADLGGVGMFAWHDAVPQGVQASFARAREAEARDDLGADADGFAYWDAAEDLWWTYETPARIRQHKMPQIVQARGLGGVFAWGLGEDAPAYAHFRATGAAWREAVGKGEVGDRVGEGDEDGNSGDDTNGRESRDEL